MTKEERAQTVSRFQEERKTSWELCVSDGGGDERGFKGFLKQLAAGGDRVFQEKMARKISACQLSLLLGLSVWGL